MPDVVQPALHGRDHCPGGADPIPCLGAFVHLLAWNYDTDNTAATATWTPVGNFAGGGGFFEESYFRGDWGFSYDTGAVTLDTTAEYLIQGWVQFNEDANDGEKRIVALNFGASDRHIAVFPFEASLGTIAQLKLPVTSMRSTTLGTTSVQVEVWHDHGSDLTIRDAELAVHLTAPASAATGTQHGLRP